MATTSADMVEWSHHEACTSSRVDSTSASCPNTTGDLVAEPVTTADPHILNWDPEVEKLLDVDDTRSIGGIKDSPTLQHQQQSMVRLTPAPQPPGLVPTFTFDANNVSTRLRPSPGVGATAPPSTSFWPPASSDNATAIFRTACPPCDNTLGTPCVTSCLGALSIHSMPQSPALICRREEKIQAAINFTTPWSRSDDVLTEPNDSIAASKLTQGTWIFIASYVNGEDHNRDAFVIVWASPNASENMFGIDGLDLTGFPIHPVSDIPPPCWFPPLCVSLSFSISRPPPHILLSFSQHTLLCSMLAQNPADFFCAEPRVFMNHPHGTQYRWKPFGGQNDLGSMIYVDTRVIRESSGYLLILAADLGQHGHITDHDVHRLDRLGVFSSLDVGFSRPVRWTWPTLDDPPAERHHDTMRRMGFSLWMHKLNRSLQALDLVQKCAFPVPATFQPPVLFGNQPGHDQGHHADRDWLTLIRVPFLDRTVLSDLQISHTTALPIVQNRSP